MPIPCNASGAEGRLCCIGFGCDAADVAIYNQLGPPVYPTAQTVRVEYAGASQSLSASSGSKCEANRVD